MAGSGKDAAATTRGRQPFTVIEKPVPSDVDAEEAVLGSILIDPEAVEKVAAIVQPTDFYRDVNNWIYGACLAVHARGEGVNEITVLHELGRHDRIEAVGGPAYTSRLIAQCPTSVHAADYAEIVLRCATLRRLVSVTGDLARRAYANEDPNEIIGRMVDQLQGLRRLPAAPESATTWADLREAIGPIEWAWSVWLPRGLLTLLAAEQEAGKSLLALRIAQTFITGQAWPDGMPYEGDTGAVLWCEAESAQAMNLERAAKWGIPDECLHAPFADPFTDVRLDDPAHRAAIMQAARHPDVRLVIFDSLRGATRKEEKESSFGDAAFWLAELARNIKLPVLAIHHLRKAGVTDRKDAISLDRLRGHSSVTQAARVVWALDVPNPAHPDDRRVYQIKNNLGPKPKAIGMSVDDDGCFFGAAPKAPREESQVDKAEDLLTSLLAGGARPFSQIVEEFEGAAISKQSMYRAKDKLRIISVRRNDRWIWSLAVDEDGD